MLKIIHREKMNVVVVVILGLGKGNYLMMIFLKFT